MSCGDAGRKKSVYTGNQVGYLNYVGFFNFVAGGSPGSGLSAGTTVVQFIPKSTNRAVWKRQDAVFDDKLLDAAYSTIDLQWFAEITLGDVTFRVSNRSFYVQDVNGVDRYYDARCDMGPSISVDVGEWLQPNYQVSDLNIELNNRDGYFNDYLAMGKKFRQWTGAHVVVKIGFGEKYSNYFTIFEGQVAEKQGLSTTRDTISLVVWDKLTGDNIPMPPRYFSSDNYPSIDEAYASKPIPLVYGDWTESVPKWGAVNAIITNANDSSPDFYTLKISDVALGLIRSIWLHRGSRTAEKPEGPIRVASNVLKVSLDQGQVIIPTAGIVLDEPYFITDQGKAATGSGVGVITSDTGFDFLAQGVKVGDKVINGTLAQAVVTAGNIEFKPSAQGTAGNNFRIDYVLLSPSLKLDYTGDPIDYERCYATKISNTQIQVGITQYYDNGGTLRLGAHAAIDIKTAIEFNPDTTLLVRCNLVGTVPTGAPSGETIERVDQTVPAGPFLARGGTDAGLTALITTVANYEIGVASSHPFVEGETYAIATTQYTFVKGDKFSVVCTGKPLQNVSTNRLSDVSPLIQTPDGFVVDFSGNYWIADNKTQALYNVSFKNKILKTIPFSQIGASVSYIAGLSITNDNNLWIAEQSTSTIYRFNLNTGTTGLVIPTAGITGLGAALTGITGVAIQPNNQFWISDKFQKKFYLIEAFSGSGPYVVRSFSSLTSDVNSTEITDIAYDSAHTQLTYVDRGTNRFYRISESDGALISFINITGVNPNASYISGLYVAQDASLFFLDASNLAIYNYNDMKDANNNPALIARDLLQQFRGHTYNEFDLSWNNTATQLSVFRSRLVYEKNDKKLVEQINNLLGQFNVVFHLRFQKYALFWITFDNFRITGRVAKEKDLQIDTFTPEKEFSQYFNEVNANTDYSPFSTGQTLSDTYISPSAIAFAREEVLRTLELSSIYRRTDIDEIMPLYVRLSAAEPEFVTATFGFRLIRTQMHDFLNLNFSDDGFDRSGRPTVSGRRFKNVPCMVRKLQYDLDAMTVQMKLWSLGNTSFAGYTAPGNTVGGKDDPIVLSNLGRAGRVSPVAQIISASSNTITAPAVDGYQAEQRKDALNNYAWVPGYKVDLIDGASKAVVQTLTIASVSAGVITFLENFTTAPTSTTSNLAGFIIGGNFIQYSTYDNLIAVQKKLYASFGKPTTNYPTNHTQELADQRSGANNFADNGQPYVLYPRAFLSN
jgi:hypothetical protein